MIPLHVFPKLPTNQRPSSGDSNRNTRSSLSLCSPGKGKQFPDKITFLFHILPFKHFTVLLSSCYRRTFAVIFQKAKAVTQVSRHPSQHWMVPAVTDFIAMTHHSEGFFNSISHCNHTLRLEMLLKKAEFPFLGFSMTTSEVHIQTPWKFKRKQAQDYVSQQRDAGTQSPHIFNKTKAFPYPFLQDLKLYL